MCDPRSPSTATDFGGMGNEPGQSTTNDITKGVDDLEASSTGVGCLTVVDDPGTYSVSGGITWRLLPGASSSVVACSNRGGRSLSILYNCWLLKYVDDPGAH